MATIHTIKIPAGVNIAQEDGRITVSGPRGVVRREMQYPGITIACDGRECTVGTASRRKDLIAMCGTFAAHIRNMCRGVTEGYEYRMKVVYSHFPIQLKVVGDRVEINNFLGEKKPRYATIREGVKVAVGNDEVVISGIDKESVGNTAASIERATKIRYRDPRVFQDGIYLVERV
ncbi:MAG: 50S ribosomal protein L6 [Methanomicrobiales archaeon]|nr:50S ribosomal protein L6 [Methanomicrobiales archaeon]MDI6875940.1 50S ribosomal protein L6 [Methanomicrobiales archaeon]